MVSEKKHPVPISSVLKLQYYAALTWSTIGHRGCHGIQSSHSKTAKTQPIHMVGHAGGENLLLCVEVHILYFIHNYPLPAHYGALEVHTGSVVPCIYTKYLTLHTVLFSR